MKITRIFRKRLNIFLIGLVIALTVVVMRFIVLSQPNSTQTTDSVNDEVLGIETIDIISEKYMFSPTLIPLKKGKRVRLTLRTYDVQHGISVPELGISLSAYPGRPAETIVVPEKIGEFTTNCSLYCGKDHNKMKLTFKIYE